MASEKNISMEWVSVMEQKKNALELKGVKKYFKIDGKEVRVLEDITLDIKEGEFVSVVGTSGCGKSTLLRIISGLEQATEGFVKIADRIVDKPSTDCGMVFQEARLFPWLKMSENIRYGITEKNKEKLSKKEQDDKIAELIKLVGLEGFENALPRQLSGGMQQRASIARALINRPEVLLLDEPFGALDALNRINMQIEILRIWEQEKKTMIMVTHDIDEAIFLGSRIIVMSSKPGVIKEVIDVELPRPRDRTGEDFAILRKRVFELLFENRQSLIEYYI